MPDLYIIHIAIGEQGVREKYMWNPGYEKKLIPGKLKEVDISLFPFTTHILSLLEKSLEKSGKTELFTTLHWRGGEEDAVAKKDAIEPVLKETYKTLFNGFYTTVVFVIDLIRAYKDCTKKMTSDFPSVYTGLKHLYKN